jgi:proton-dependent oligopeptide transporter, POT family
VGLSMGANLSPKRLVSTMMGGWFLSTAFAEYLAGVIARFTGVSGHGEEAGTIPPPIETVHVYGGVFGHIAVATVISALVLFALVPLIKKGIHADQPTGN